MVGEVLEWLVTDPAGTYLDLNVGDGGHADAICERLGDHPFRYVGIDLDPASLASSQRRLARYGERITLLCGSHGDFAELITRQGIGPVTGMLFDLGFSSSQLDHADRGLAFDADGPLDMRYGERGPTAAEFLATASESKMNDAFRTYGDLRGARRLARAIVARRSDAPLTSTGELAALIDEALRPHPLRRRKILSQVFQSVRVVVNDEVGAFERALESSHEQLIDGGAIVVLAYESVTDRLAKREFHPPNVERDAFGHPVHPPKWERLTRRAVKPSDEEVARNPRARSARLRAARKLSGEAQ
jgi:16S rRNA (cytosine1402-N4)-methyltransferase